MSAGKSIPIEISFSFDPKKADPQEWHKNDVRYWEYMSLLHIFRCCLHPCDRKYIPVYWSTGQASLRKAAEVL